MNGTFIWGNELDMSKGIRIGPPHTSPYKDEDEIERTGLYASVPRIDRNSVSARGRIYDNYGELVFVDDDSKIMLDAQNYSMRRLRRVKRKPLIDQLQKISSLVGEILRYDLEAAESLFTDHYVGAQEEEPLKLSQYVEAGVGVCRHQCLLAALILERAIEKGILPIGEIRVERNENIKPNGDRGSHAWAIYRYKGVDYVVDAAMKNVGEREAAGKRVGWRYDLED
jgi:hypothetical protein